jgi:mannose-6-phosphate isomerase-like protein (cupin superfamily)
MRTDVVTTSPEVAVDEISTPDPGVTVYELALGAAPFKAARFTVDPGASSAIDAHAVHETWFIVSGEGELVYDGRAYPLKTHDFFRFRPPLPHQVHNRGAEPIVIFSTWWQP